MSAAIEPLRLSVSRTWGRRTMATDSDEWRALRQQVLERDKYTCTYCGIVSAKYMMCTHMDNNNGNNDLSNLNIVCPLCSMIRYCGLAGLSKKLALYSSDIDQVEIVKRSCAYYMSHGKIPLPEIIDPNCRFVSDSTVTFANFLLTGSTLSKEQLTYKGFFSDGALEDFAHIIDRSGQTKTVIAELLNELRETYDSKISLDKLNTIIREEKDEEEWDLQRLIYALLEFPDCVDTGCSFMLNNMDEIVDPKIPERIVQLFAKIKASL